MTKVLAITGYKPFELGIFDKNHQGIRYIKKAILKRLVSLIEEGLEWVIISGLLGVELWAAEVVMDLQMEYPELKLAVITPFLNQEEKWNEANKEQYEAIYLHADYTNSITHRKYENPDQFRLKNRFFIDKSDALLIVYDEEKDGSPKYIYNDAKYASEQSGYRLIIIDSYDLQAIVEEENLEKDGF